MATNDIDKFVSNKLKTFLVFNHIFLSPAWRSMMILVLCFLRILNRKGLSNEIYFSAVDSYLNPGVFAVIAKLREIRLRPFSELQNSGGALAPTVPSLSKALFSWYFILLIGFWKGESVGLSLNSPNLTSRNETMKKKKL